MNAAAERLLDAQNFYGTDRADPLVMAELADVRSIARYALAAAEQTARLECYARSLEDEIVFRLQDALVAIHEDEHADEDELRELAGAAYAAAVERWDALFANAPTRPDAALADLSWPEEATA